MDVIRRDRTPEGDGNQALCNASIIVDGLEKIEPQKGTETGLPY